MTSRQSDNSPLVGLVAIVMAAAAVFHARGLSLPFLAEDYLEVLQDPAGGSIFAVLWRPELHTIEYRPLADASWALDRALWGRWPLGFLLTNLALFAVAAGLTSAFVARLLESRRAGLFAGACFVLSPLTPEVSSWSMGRPELLGIVFGVAACLAMNAQRLRLGLVLYLLGLLANEWVLALLPVLWLLRPGVTAAGSLGLVTAAFVGVRAYMLGSLVGGYRQSLGHEDAGYVAERLDYLQALFLQMPETLLSGGARLGVFVAVLVWIGIGVVRTGKLRAAALAVVWIVGCAVVHSRVRVDPIELCDARFVVPALPGFALLLALAVWARGRFARIAVPVVGLVMVVGLWHAQSEWAAAGAAQRQLLGAVGGATRAGATAIEVHGLPASLGRGRFGIRLDALGRAPFRSKKDPPLLVTTELRSIHRGRRRAAACRAMLQALLAPRAGRTLLFWDPDTASVRDPAEIVVRTDVRGGVVAGRLECGGPSLRFDAGVEPLAGTADRVFAGRLETDGSLRVRAVAHGPRVLHWKTAASSVELSLSGEPNAFYAVFAGAAAARLALPGVGLVQVGAREPALTGYLDRAGRATIRAPLPPGAVPRIQAILFGPRGRVVVSRCLCADPAWPRWRGPDGDGVSTERDWVLPAEQPLWRANVGTGYSNVAIAERRLFTLGFRKAIAKDRLVCLDAATGAEIWHRDQPARDDTANHTGGTLSTPTVEAGRVYVLHRDGVGLCLNAADGAVRWSRDYVAAAGLRRPVHGFASSPLVVGERLVLVMGGAVVAVAKDDGRVLWRTADRGEGSYANPAIVRTGSTAQVAVLAGPAFLVLDVETGRVVHEFEWKQRANGFHCATPIVSGRDVFLSAGLGKGCVMLRLGTQREPQVLWRGRGMRNRTTDSVLFAGHLYGFDEQVLKCFDRSGAEQWRARGLRAGAVSVAGDALLVLTGRGELCTARATPARFEVLARTAVFDRGKTWTAPVLAGGLIYCRNSLGDLCCLDARPRPGATRVSVAVPPSAAPKVPTAAALFEQNATWYTGASTDSFVLKGLALDEDGRKLALTARFGPDHGSWSTAERECGFDAEAAWSRAKGEPWQLTSPARHREWSAMRSPLWIRRWRQLFRDLARPEPATFGGRAAFVVTATSRAGVQRRVYFDATTQRLIGFDAVGESVVRYFDWHDVAGARLPMRIVAIDPVNGRQVEWRIVSMATSRTPWRRPAAIADLLARRRAAEGAQRAAVARLGAFAGTYESKVAVGGERVAMDVRVEAGALLLRSRLTPRLSFRDAGDGRFASQDGAITLRFAKDEAGACTGLTLRIGGTDYAFDRVE